ncbi:hypothetical protein HDU98_007959, partial [Podochytrium sp. JEL0797]
MAPNKRLPGKGKSKLSREFLTPRTGPFSKGLGLVPLSWRHADPQGKRHDPNRPVETTPEQQAKFERFQQFTREQREADRKAAEDAAAEAPADDADAAVAHNDRAQHEFMDFEDDFPPLSEDADGDSDGDGDDNPHFAFGDDFDPAERNEPWNFTGQHSLPFVVVPAERMSKYARARRAIMSGFQRIETQLLAVLYTENRCSSCSCRRSCKKSNTTNTNTAMPTPAQKAKRSAQSTPACRPRSVPHQTPSAPRQLVPQQHLQPLQSQSPTQLVPTPSAQSGPKTAGAKRATRKLWDRDQVTPDRPTSLEFLVDKLTSGTFYSRYRGGASSGTTKEGYCGEISREMAEVGLIRDYKAIRVKIAEIEAEFKTAVDWLNNTGEGIRADDLLSDGEKNATIKKCVLERCPLYDRISEVMADRPNARPLATNEDGPSIPFARESQSLSQLDDLSDLNDNHYG